MKNVFLLFLLTFCFSMGVQSLSAQIYVNPEKASIRLKGQLELMMQNQPTTTSVAFEAKLRQTFYFTVLETLPQDSAEYDQHIDAIYERLSQNGTTKNAGQVAAIRGEIKELLRA